MVQVFGGFIEDLPHGEEYLEISFLPNSVPLKQRWRANGVSADFIAEYLKIFSVGLADVPLSLHNQSAVKYIANELLENAMKYSDETTQFTTKIAFHLYPHQVIFQATNSVAPQDLENFQQIIRKIIHSKEPHELYIQQMEANVENDTSSGLGFLSMICDYSAKLGWKFEELNNPPLRIVTTMVSLPL